MRRFATWIGSSARSLSELVSRCAAARPSHCCLLNVSREIRNNIFAHHIATSQDDPTTMLMINRQLAAEYVEKVILHHHHYLPHIVTDLHIRFPGIEFNISVPQIGAEWLEITTLTLSLPVSLRNIRNPIILETFLTKVLRMRMLPFTDTLKIVLQPPQWMPTPQRMPEKGQTNRWHTPTHMILWLEQYVLNKFVDSDEEVRRESVGRVIVCWERGAGGTTGWRGLSRRLPELEVQSLGWFGVGD